MAVQYNNRLRVRIVMVLPASCPHHVVVTMGNCRHKNQSPRHSPGLEVEAVVTMDKCIKAK